MTTDSVIARDNVIVKLDRARQQLAEAKDIQQTKRILDIAGAAEIYARRQKLGEEAIEYAHAIKCEALRRLGEMLKETPKNKGARGHGPGRGKKGPGKSLGPFTKDATPTYAELGLDYETASVAQQLAALPTKEFAKVRDGEQTVSQAIRDTKRTVAVKKLYETAAQSPALPVGTFDVLVIDPPWPMMKIERDVRPNQVEFDYPIMSEAELLAWDIPRQFAAKDCHVFLWTTHRFLPLAIRCLERWAFSYVLTFVWHKPGGYQPVGLPQYNCEFCLYARKGTPLFLDTKDFPVCFQAARGAHSEKPEAFYSLLRRVTGGRRLDICNRRVIEGFVGYGQEAV